MVGRRPRPWTEADKAAGERWRGRDDAVLLRVEWRP